MEGRHSRHELLYLCRWWAQLPMCKQCSMPTTLACACRCSGGRPQLRRQADVGRPRPRRHPLRADLQTLTVAMLRVCTALCACRVAYRAADCNGPRRLALARPVAHLHDAASC